jgi:hypothetical protein
MLDATILTMLVPGSVWERTRKGNTSHVTVLTVSNGTLKEETLENFPQQVVFITERGEVMTQTIEFFVAKRNFVTVNTQFEAAVEALIQSANAEEPEIEDLDNIELPDEDQSKALEAFNESLGGKSDSDIIEVDDPVMVQPFTLVDSDHELADLLSGDFVSYTESPWTDGQVLHALKFSLDELALEDLETVFVKEHQRFVINTADCLTTLADAAPISIGLEVRGTVSYGCVYFSSKAVPKEEVAEVKVEQTGSHQAVTLNPAPTSIVVGNVVSAGHVAQPNIAIHPGIPLAASHTPVANVGVTVTA